MNELSGDFLMTYNPNCVEEHSDSTDFEEYENTPPTLLKDNTYYFITKERKESVKNHTNRKVIKNCTHDNKKIQNKENIAIGQSQIIESSRIISVNNINPEPIVKQLHNNGFNSDDQFKTKSKRSFMRHKVMPCLSIMFGRSFNKMYTIQENGNTDLRKDTSCQVRQVNWEQRGTRKFNKRQNYTVQPVHILEGLTHEFTPIETKNSIYSKLPLPNEKCPKADFWYNDSTATKSSHESDELRHYNKRFRKRFQTEVRKEYLKYHSNKFMKHQKQQCPSVQSLYQVFTTPDQQQSKVLNTSSNYNSSFCPSIPSTSSGFWNYLFNRFYKKYQTQRVEMPKPCHCYDSHAGSYSGEYEYCEVKQHDSPESDSWQNIGSVLPPRDVKPNYLQRNNQHESIPVPTLPVPGKKKTKSNKKVQCDCYPEKGQCSGHVSKLPEPSLPQAPTGGRKCCQELHNQLTDALIKKYNGEILCIHNPPCVLINGCLNLPTINEPTSVNVWTAATHNNNNFLRPEKKDRKKSCDQDCQHYSPNFEVRQCQTPEYKSEKLIQSACNHSPPCEVVRCCYNSKYYPKLNNSCIHVPLCDKIPECVMKGKPNEAVVFLERRPKCRKLPMCLKNYIVLTARDSVGTQARPPSKTVCRHEPPCIMIPKCLSQVLQDTHISRSNVPYCIHQPHCEMIPACCRRSTKKDMVSVCSQYPNGCRLA